MFVHNFINVSAAVHELSCLATMFKKRCRRFRGQ